MDCLEGRKEGSVRRTSVWSYSKQSMELCRQLKQFTKHNDKGSVFVMLWVDNCYFIGANKLLDETVEGLKMFFKVKMEESPQDFLSCQIHHNKDESKH